MIDGDTLVVAGRHIRLFGIDAPEKGQACTHPDVGGEFDAGLFVRRWLIVHIGDRDVRCTRRAFDRYGRWLADCDVAGGDLATVLVGNGWARAYCADPPLCQRYSPRYLAAEDRAKTRGFGFWGGQCDAPWDWRNANRR